jgi:hypothetical protein
MLVCGLLVPAHLRAVEESVIQRAGRNAPALIEQGLAFAREKNLGTAQLLLQAARQTQIPGNEKLAVDITNLIASEPQLQILGAREPELERLLASRDAETTRKYLESASRTNVPFTDFILRLDNRERALALLRASARPAVQDLLRCRELTNTVIFPPARSASGQAFDAAVSICGLLLEKNYLSTSLARTISDQAGQASRGGNPQPLEQALLDFLSLGQRFNWGQLVTFVAHIEDAETLRLQANLARKAEAQVPVLFAAVALSERPTAVAQYLVTFSRTGMKDLAASLRFGAGGVRELVQRNHPLHTAKFHNPLASAFSGLAWRTPWFALTLKWLLYLGAGFLLAMALHFARPPVADLERPLQVRGFHVARETLFALGFLLVVLLVSEPFLAQDSQKMEFPFRLRLPMVGNAAPAGTTRVNAPLMNQTSLLTLLLFFVLQGLLYTACIVKLAEIRRQRVPARVKLRLLENEDHLFDAGLYLGFAGTIVSLILVSLGVFKQPSLMAAYSATAFGILFVSFFKICNLRPVRRRLLLEAETAADKAAPLTVPAHDLAAPL